MKNVAMTVDEKSMTLTITVDLSQSFGLSGSGKSVIIASTEGNAALEGAFSEIKVGLNVFKKAVK